MPHQCTNCGRGFPDGSKEMLSGCPDCGGSTFRFAPAGRERDGSVDDGSVDDGSVDDGSVDDGSNASGGPAPERTDEAPERTDEAPERTDEAPERTDETDPGSTPAGCSAASSELESGADSGTEAGTSDETAAGTSDDDPDGSSPPSRQPTEPHAGRRSSESFEWVGQDGEEDAAQASARSDVVGRDELPPPSERPAEPDRDPSPQPATGSTSAERGRDEPVRDERHVDGPAIDGGDGSRPSLEELRDELNDQFESIKILEPGQYELNLMELYDREERIISLQEDGRYVIDVPDAWHATDE